MSPGQVHLVVHDRGRDLTGVVRAGESWAQAARRTCASMHADPVPVDLSGDPKEFAVDHDQVVTVRAMTRGDLPDLLRWLRSAHIRRWWDEREVPTEESVAARYGPRIDGISPTRMWVAEVNGRSAGFVQDYRIGDYPEHAVLRPDADAIGVDFALAEEWCGRGLGAVVLWVWMLRTRRRRPEAPTYFAAPDHRNAASRRMLAKAGFTEGLWFDEPRHDSTAATLVGCSLEVTAVLG